MTVALHGHGDLSFNWRSWACCLDVAVAFGWEPEGTILPDDPEGARYRPDRYHGGYDSNDHQLVTDTDARALSWALNRALAALRTGRMTEEQADALYYIRREPLRDLRDLSARGGFRIC